MINLLTGGPFWPNLKEIIEVEKDFPSGSKITHHIIFILLKDHPLIKNGRGNFLKDHTTNEILEFISGREEEMQFIMLKNLELHDYVSYLTTYGNKYLKKEEINLFFSNAEMITRTNNLDHLYYLNSLVQPMERRYLENGDTSKARITLEKINQYVKFIYGVNND